MIVAPKPPLLQLNSTAANRGGPLLLWPEAAVEELKTYWSLLPFVIDWRRQPDFGREDV